MNTSNGSTRHYYVLAVTERVVLEPHIWVIVLCNDIFLCQEFWRIKNVCVYFLFCRVSVFVFSCLQIVGRLCIMFAKIEVCKLICWLLFLIAVSSILVYVERLQDITCFRSFRYKRILQRWPSHTIPAAYHLRQVICLWFNIGFYLDIIHIFFYNN